MSVGIAFADDAEYAKVLRQLFESGNLNVYAEYCRRFSRTLQAEEYEVLCNIIAEDFYILKADIENLLDFICQESDLKRVAFYSNVWVLGGIERVCTLLMEELKSDYNLLLITSCNNPDEGEKGFALPQNVLHVRTIRSAAIPLHYQIAFISLLAGIDVLIGNPNIMAEFLPIYEYLKPFPIRTVAFNHYFYGLPYLSDQFWLKKLAFERKKALKYADVCVWLTSFSAISAKHIHPYTIKIANPNTFAAMECHELPKKKIILAVGRFSDAVKRIDRIFEVFRHVLKTEPDAQLLIVGDYNADMVFPGTKGRSIGAYVENELGIPNTAICFCGNQNDVVPFYKEASVLILTSECEGYAMVLREAGVAGVPVIVSNYPGSSDIIEHGVNGYRIDFDEGGFEKAAEYITGLFRNQEQWQKMSIAAQKAAAETDISVIGSQWRILLDMLINHGEEEYEAILRENNFFPDEKREMKAYAEGKYFLESMLDEAIQWQEKCLIMEASLSWRITKPVRWAAKCRRTITEKGLLKAIKEWICPVSPDPFE